MSSEEKKDAVPTTTPVVDITSEAHFDEALKAAQGKVLVDFVDADCGTCEEEAPEVEQIARDCEGKAVVLRVNVDKVPELAERFEVYGEQLGGTPTILYAESASKMTPAEAIEVDPAGARRRLKCKKK